MSKKEMVIYLLDTYWPYTWIADRVQLPVDIVEQIAEEYFMRNYSDAIKYSRTY